MTSISPFPLHREPAPLRTPLRWRLWVAASLVVLVLPLAAAAWAFGSYAASNERTRTDARLGAELAAALNGYGRTVQGAQLQAMELAGSRRVQAALAQRDRNALAALRRAHPDTSFVAAPAAAPASAPLRRAVHVVLGDRRVGTVVVHVRLGQRLLSRLAGAAALDRPGDVLALARDGRVTASSTGVTGRAEVDGGSPHAVRLGGRAYRAVGTAIAPHLALAVLAPSSRVEAAASSIRNRILLIGLVVLAAVMLLAYALAPLIGRARLGQEQRALAERVLRHVTDAVALLDAGGVIRFWNRAAETITGVTAERAIGARADEVVGGWAEALEQIPVVDAQSLGATTAAATVPLESDDGEVWVAASGVRVDEGVVYTFRDVSEAERLDQAKTDFVATVSHELRTPLASVYGAAMTLQQHDARLSERQRDDLLVLLAEQAGRLSSIIDDILLASRLDSGRLHVEQQRCEPQHVARAVVDAARVRTRDQVEIELSTPPWLPDVAADSDKLAQVLANLVENAVKYSPGGGRVEVVVEQHDDRIRFEVRDEGLGIPLGEQERVFEKFYRLDPNLTRGIGGTGLGLYISNELVRRMGGEIHLRSTPGEGSLFWFELPVAEAVKPVHAAG